MNYKLIPAVLALILPGITCAQTWEITGRIEGTAIENLQLRELDLATGEYHPLATVPVQADGRFDWQGKWSEPTLYRLEVDSTSMITLAIDQPEAVTITITETANAARTSSITGSRGTTWLRTFPGKLQQLLGHHFGALKGQMEAAVAKKDKERIAELEEKIAQQFPLFTADLKYLVVDSLGITAAVYGLWDYIDPNKGMDILDAVVAQFQKQHPSWEVTRALSRKLSAIKGLGPGVAAPDFQLSDRQGKVRALSDYRGQYLFVDFWASWCLACRAEKPRLVELYQAFAGDRFAMLGVGIKDEKSAWSKAIEKDRLPWPQLLDKDNRVAELYFIQSLPQNVFIDPDGTILARNLNAAELAELLKDLL